MLKNVELKKHQIITNDLVHDIKRGHYKENERILSETELMQIYNVSRITARKSLDNLEQAGFIYKIQGKGSFVLEKKPKQSLLKIHSFTDEILNAGMTPTREVLKKDIILATPFLASKLQMPLNGRILSIERIVRADGKILCLTKSFIPIYLFSNIEKFDFSEISLYQIIQEEYGVLISKTSLDIDVICIDETIATKMLLSPNTPLLYLTITAYQQKENTKVPVEFSKTYYNPSIITYTIDKYDI